MCTNGKKVKSTIFASRHTHKLYLKEFRKFNNTPSIINLNSHNTV